MLGIKKILRLFNPNSITKQCVYDKYTMSEG
mgnify:FL=1